MTLCAVVYTVICKAHNYDTLTVVGATMIGRNILCDLIVRENTNLAQFLCDIIKKYNTRIHLMIPHITLKWTCFTYRINWKAWEMRMFIRKKVHIRNMRSASRVKCWQVSFLVFLGSRRSTKLLKSLTGSQGLCQVNHSLLHMRGASVATWSEVARIEDFLQAYFCIHTSPVNVPHSIVDNYCWLNEILRAQSHYLIEKYNQSLHAKCIQIILYTDLKK